MNVQWYPGHMAKTRRLIGERGRDGEAQHQNENQRENLFHCVFLLIMWWDLPEAAAPFRPERGAPLPLHIF